MSVTEPDAPALDAEWEEAFAEICDRHRGRLIRWLTSIFGARDAEDIAQEALVRLFVRPGLLDPATDAWPWLAVVARNVGRDMAKRNAQTKAVDHLTLAEVADERAVWDQVLARDDAERLVRALRALKPRDRALIRLRDLQDIPMNEVAARLGVTENAARQQLFRARRRLADAYTELGGDRLGLLPTLGLRLREAFRHHANVLEPLGLSSPAVFAAFLPCLACAAGLLGGALFPSAGAGAGAAGRAAAGLSAERDVGHGTGARPPRSDGNGAAEGTSGRIRLPATRPDDPVVEVHKAVGDATVDSTIYKSPLDNSAGTSDETGVWVDLPVLGRTGASTDGYKPRDGCNFVCP